jgi:hypothetical protein
LEEVQTTISQRIKFLLEHFNMSARNFSRALGVPDNNTQNYLGAKPALPKADYLEQILLCFQSVNPEWLLTGRGEPFRPKETEASTTQTGNFNQAGTSNTQKVRGNKNNVQNNNGDHATITNTVKLEQCHRDLASSKKDVEHLQAQLAAKDDLIASKDALIALQAETLSLLRGGYTRPN